ncbi:MAG: T9SS type A sorting domain-containing protein [Phycisphaerae bacterium]|nr:T9SS type A sorting domain-containing protein [Saprospiraceae bacterium]
MQKSILLSSLLSLICLSGLAQSPWSLVSETQTNNYYSIYAVNKDKVVTTAEWGMLFQSNDGGHTMQAYQLDSNFSLFYDVAFLGQQHGFAGGGCYFTTDDCVENVIASTTDGGQNWVWKQIAAGVGVLADLSVLPDGTVFALGDYNGLFRRQPLSQNWDSLGRPGIIESGAYTGMQFLDTKNGFIEHWTFEAGQNLTHLLRTTDGGLQWTEVLTGANSSQQPFYYFLDTLHGFQLSNNGQLGRTVDGGTSWTTEQAFGTSEAILKLDFVNPSVGYLSTWEMPAQIGRMYRSTDGGAHWSLDLKADSVYLQDFHFADTENGYAISNYRQILRRTGSVSTSMPQSGSILSITPNPVYGLATITLPENRTGDALQIFDSLGRMVQQIELAKGQQEITFLTSGLRAGIYFLAIQGQADEVIKFVVN